MFNNMGQDGVAGDGLLAPPVVNHLRSTAGLMERSLSEDIRVEREDLRQAAEETLNVIMDLGLDGTIRWVSPSWTDVVGTSTESVQGTPIVNLLLDENKTMFKDAMENMKKDDSRSQIIKFTLALGSRSKLALPASAPEPAEEGMEAFIEEDTQEKVQTVTLEAQGIMVYDRAADGADDRANRGSHTMWMARPYIPPREVKIDLPPLVVESLGSGAEILAHYLTTMADTTGEDSLSHAPPLPVLCRICERQIPPWWFEKHTELCLQEHKAEMEVQMCQENLVEHRHAIVKVLDALEARKSRPSTSEHSISPAPQAEYKSMPIGPAASPVSSSGSASPGTPPAGRSRETSMTGGLGHARARSFAVRRPQARIVELLLDLCDTAIEISTPAIKEGSTLPTGEFRTQSPQSESRISQVMQWQSPSNNTLEQEQGLALLCADSEKAAKSKVEAVLRHRRIIEYSERIRMEFSIIVQDCIDEAIHKAARIAAGELSDSSSEDDAVTAQDDGFFMGSFDGPSSLAQALRAEASNTGRPTSSAVSTRSNSPREIPTPRSNFGAMSILGNSRDSRRNSLLFESDHGDSDGSVRSSSLMSRHGRNESPVSEFGDLRRAASSRQQQRRSLIMPGTISPHRQESPSRIHQPSSPLRMPKPRGFVTHDALTSPIMSPLLPHQGEFRSEFSSPALIPHRHRRQSSAGGSDAMIRPPISPRLASVSAPQARAVPPSIKDFEIIKPISKGAFGSVYLSKKKLTGDYYAIKVLKKADMVAKNQVTNVKAERAIMMWQGESDFVAKLYWTFSSKDYLYLVMEYLNGGDCASLIKILGGLPEDWAKKYLGEVILGVEHLHSRGIVHRDLKPDNLLIDQKGHLKLTDFGLSRMGLIGRQKRVLNSTAAESAPDLLKNNAFARTSLASSRSTSFDFQGNTSPGSTPQMTPDLAGSLGQPSYFSLNRENSIPRNSRRTSGHRSDSGGSDTLSQMFSSFSLNESQVQIFNQRKTPIQETGESDGQDSPDFLPLHTTTSHLAELGYSTPPQTMLPPPMALFDPDDNNRRFVGTPDYLAPETVNGVGQDEMSDWWSVGCILFEFLFGYPPFHAETPDEVFENILARRISWPDEGDFDVSSDAKDLMNKLLCIDPTHRIGSNNEELYTSGGEEIRNHAWFEGTNWDTLLEDEPQFVPAPENPEDTEYFDSRGATLQAFAEEMEDQLSPAVPTPGQDYPDRPHDALSRVRSQVNSIKRGLMPLHIPPHVRDMKSRRLSEPVQTDDFGNFAFKNLPVLEKANKDVIQKLRAEAMAAQAKPAVVSPGAQSSTAGSPGPQLEGSPFVPMPVKRTLSNAKGHRPGSPSSQAASSPSRASQPSSPLLLSFVAGQNAGERRKTSSNSSSLSHHSTSSLQPGNFFDINRQGVPKGQSSVAVSPIKTRGAPPPLSFSSPQKISTPRQSSGSRARSQTVGSQEGSPSPADIFSQHHKRRSQVFDMSPSSSDNEGDKANALLRVQRRRQSSRRMSQITLAEGPMFRPLDVLICEDHPVSRMVMEKLLEKLRCRTITVTNGAEAMRYAMSEIKFDIIMMEFKLPQINGADVARMIRDTKNANSQTPIVAITGYLKELQAPHHFDALIEKPPTTSKLTEVLCRLCQWRAPTPGQTAASLSLGYPLPSGLRESLRLDDSPTSGSSGFANMPGSSYRGSSREDSISSSLFGDTESTRSDDVPVIINRQATNDWHDSSNVSINEESMLDLRDVPKPLPIHLLQQHSAPVQMELPKTPSRQRSLEKIKAKRNSMEKHRHECAESGDDEDEELGDTYVREKSPKHPNSHTRAHRGSKLGIEMMRTNSRGSIVSGSEATVGPDEISFPPTVKEEQHPTAEITGTSLTPPEMFLEPGEMVEEIDLDETPRPTSQATPDPVDLDQPTPRASSQSSSYLNLTPSR